jgi:hypothetical protein
MEKRKFLTYQDMNSEPSVVQPIASQYTDCGADKKYRGAMGTEGSTSSGKVCF